MLLFPRKAHARLLNEQREEVLRRTKVKSPVNRDDSDSISHHEDSDSHHGNHRDINHDKYASKESMPKTTKSLPRRSSGASSSAAGRRNGRDTSNGRDTVRNRRSRASRGRDE
jgi:hypothetical protein